MFALDTNAARAADVKTATIQTAGKYKGKIVCVEYLENTANGSKNVRIVFRSDDGQDASFFLNMVYQHNQQNESSHKLLSAILACIKLRNTGNTASGSVEKWNADLQKREQVAALVFPDMAGKRIGLLIQMEIEKKSEKGYPRPIIYMPFDAETEKTASEVLAVPPVLKGETLAKAVQYIAEHQLVDRRPKSGLASAAPAGFGGQAQSAPDLDDDIPF